MKKVYYVGYYVEDEYVDSFFSVLSGKLKMKYVYDKLNECGFDTKIISLCHKEKKVVIKKNNSIKYFFTIPKKNKLFKIVNISLIKLQLMFWYLFKTKKTDTIVLYHAYTFTKFFDFLRKLKKVPMILEVEEVYGFSSKGRLPYLDKEISYIKSYDKAILVNDYLPKELEFLEKSYAVSHGVCNFAAQSSPTRFNDGKIHALYAGTLQPNKGGALSAIKAAEFLPNNFVVDIFGHGHEECIKQITDEAERINIQAGTEKVRYMGFKENKALQEIMGMYDIGLSTNIIDPDFANNTFPSKIITYMSHGLSIVSGYAEAFDGIKLSEKWSFFYEYTPKAIAEAIINYKPCTREENLKVLKKIDTNLGEWLKENI